MNRAEDQLSGRVEDDFSSKLTPIKGSSYRRLSTALPMAIVAMLVVGTVAFGATVIRPMVVGPNPSATPVDVGDDPEDSPSASISVPSDNPPATPIVETEAPKTEAPKTDPPVGGVPAGNMTLTAKLSGTKVVLSWSAFAGTDFAYYKVVRSSDAEASWPLGANDTLVAAISEQGKLTLTDSPPTGKTWTYRVFAVKSTDEGYQVLDSSNVATVAVPKPTPRPTVNCGIHLSAKIVSGHVKLTWSKYVCSGFEYYVVGRAKDSNVDFPLPHGNVDPRAEIDNRATVSWVDYDVEPGQTYWYRVMAWNSSENCNGGTVLAKSNLVKVTIPLPTKPPTEPPADNPPADETPAQ